MNRKMTDEEVENGGHMVKCQ